MPMVLFKEAPKKKPDEKVVKHKVKDIKSIKEKTNSYIEKNVKAEKNSEKGYADDTTPNKMCKIAVSAIGLSDEVIDYLTKHENFLREIDNLNFVVNQELYDAFNVFKENLLNLIENKR
jgi:cation transport regulator ChaC